MQNLYYHPNPPLKIIIRRFSSDGIYHVKRKSTYPFIEHHGVVVIGKCLKELGFYDKKPRLIHKTDSGIHAEFFDSRDWQNLKFVPARQINQEIARITMALKNPTYCLLSNNCEHFARFVMEGIEYSTQVQLAVLATSAATLLWLNND